MVLACHGCEAMDNKSQIGLEPYAFITYKNTQNVSFVCNTKHHLHMAITRTKYIYNSKNPNATNGNIDFPQWP